MPYTGRNKDSTNRTESNKIIFIELTTILSVVGVALFKAILFLWPQDVSLVHTLPDLLWSFYNWLTSSPVFAGALLSFVTWHVMYFDSAVPGINPPTPLSPTKYRALSGVDFHLNYVFALAIGPLVTALLFTDWI